MKKRTIYLDCSAGVSSDMLLAALREIATQADIDVSLPVLTHHEDGHSHEDGHHHDHGRSLADVKALIDGAKNAGERGKAIACRIYEALAKAEACVHEATPETVHFHEVGRDRAIENAVGIGEAMAALGMDESGCEVLISPVYDGTGFIDCAHGRIPVPVPAVQAMKAQCPDFQFRTAEEVKTEMVTPAGLAALIGIGAKPAGDSGSSVGSGTGKRPIARAEARGTRDTGRGGLVAYLYFM